MTVRNITSVVIAVVTVITLASCGTSRSYPDRRDYPVGYPYPTGRSYPVYGYPQRMPPGHAKKVYGYRSAKVFAPGHQNEYYPVKKYKKRSYRKY